MSAPASDSARPDARGAAAPANAIGKQQRQTFSASGARAAGPGPGQPAGGPPSAPAHTRMVVCGDIGGTKVLLALAEQQGASFRWRLQRRYMDKDYPDLTAMFADFMRIAADAALYPEDITGGCLAIAGPVDEHGRKAKLTNQPWEIDAGALASQFGTGPIRLVNDFAAAAYGIDAVDASSLVEIQAGEPEKRGARLVIGAGTGLGVASMMWQGGAEGGYKVLAGEGGHVGFAPTDELQVELWRYLQGVHGRVSNEHIASGPGLVSVYRFLHQKAGSQATADDPAKITAEAQGDPKGIAAQAQELFFRVYGAAVGDMALATAPRGGIYIAGGIAAKVLPQLQASGFLAALNDKPPQSALMQRLPVRVVTDLELGLKGAARIACGLTQV